jgi:hypothetical protein
MLAAYPIIRIGSGIQCRQQRGCVEFGEWKVKYKVPGSRMGMHPINNNLKHSSSGMKHIHST